MQRGETELAALLRGMEPMLHPAEHGYGLLPLDATMPPGLTAFALIAEDEGTTVIATVSELQRHGIAHLDGWARIGLRVHSDLSAVGLTAAIATALTGAGISANVVAGYHHDHLFVQWPLRHDAMAVLARLAGKARVAIGA